MGLKVIITGASGMVGRGVLLESLDNTNVDEVLTVNRRTIDVSDPMHKQLMLDDLGTIGDHADEITGYDACYFCAGVSSLGLSEEEYTRITYDLTLKFARVFAAQNPEAVFCYVSGTGTDSSEQGRVMWARVKGRTENDLLKMPFRAAYMFRPGYIQPMRGIRSRTWHYQLLYDIFRPVYHIIRHIPGWATNTTNVGRAMINATVHGYPSRILGNKEINILASQSNL